jgi:hypothetical protein
MELRYLPFLQHGRPSAAISDGSDSQLLTTASRRSSRSQLLHYWRFVLAARSLEAHGQRFVQLNPCGRSPYVTFSLSRSLDPRDVASGRTQQKTPPPAISLSLRVIIGADPQRTPFPAVLSLVTSRGMTHSIVASPIFLPLPSNGRVFHSSCHSIYLK